METPQDMEGLAPGRSFVWPQDISGHSSRAPLNLGVWIQELPSM